MTFFKHFTSPTDAADVLRESLGRIRDAYKRQVVHVLITTIVIVE